MSLFPAFGGDDERGGLDVPLVLPAPAPAPPPLPPSLAVATFTSPPGETGSATFRTGEAGDFDFFGAPVRGNAGFDVGPPVRETGAASLKGV